MDKILNKCHFVFDICHTCSMCQIQSFGHVHLMYVSVKNHLSPPNLHIAVGPFLNYCNGIWVFFILSNKKTWYYNSKSSTPRRRIWKNPRLWVRSSLKSRDPGFENWWLCVQGNLFGQFSSFTFYLNSYILFLYSILALVFKEVTILVAVVICCKS